MSTFSVMIYNQTRNLDGYGENVRTPFIYTYKGKMKKKLRSRCSRQDEISSASASCLLSSSIWFSWTHPTESSVSTCHIICLNSVSQETIEAYQVPTWGNNRSFPNLVLIPCYSSGNAEAGHEVCFLGDNCENKIWILQNINTFIFFLLVKVQAVKWNVSKREGENQDFERSNKRQQKLAMTPRHRERAYVKSKSGQASSVNN